MAARGAPVPFNPYGEGTSRDTRRQQEISVEAARLAAQMVAEFERSRSGSHKRPPQGEK